MLLQRSGKNDFFQGMVDVIKNRPFVILLAAYTISAFGSNLPAALILYYVEYVLQVEHAEGFLLIYFLTGILFLPFWIAISRKIGKKNAWIMSMVINTGAFAVSIFWDREMLLLMVSLFLFGCRFWCRPCTAIIHQS